MIIIVIVGLILLVIRDKIKKTCPGRLAGGWFLFLKKGLKSHKDDNDVTRNGGDRMTFVL